MRRTKNVCICVCHYDDVIMGTIASQITSLTSVYSTVYSGADQSKHQSSTSLAFVWGIHRGPVNSPHKWPVTRKMFPFDDVIMVCIHPSTQLDLHRLSTIVSSLSLSLSLSLTLSLLSLSLYLSTMNYLHSKNIAKVIIYLSIYLTHLILPINGKDDPELRLQMCLAPNKWLHA